MSPELDSLRKQLERARRYCDFLREQRAGYGLRVPADLELELEEKEQEVADLEARLQELEGGAVPPPTGDEQHSKGERKILHGAAQTFVQFAPLGGSGGILVSFLMEQAWLKAIAMFPVTAVTVVWAAYTESLLARLQEIYRERGRKDADAAIAAMEQWDDSLQQQRAAATTDEEYLQRQGNLCQDDRVEGMREQQFLIPQLDEVFVPLELSTAFRRSQQGTTFPLLPGFEWEEESEPDEPRQWFDFFQRQAMGLSIWDLLRQGSKSPTFRRLAILAWGGYGKTTLLRHVTYCYTARKLERGVPKLLPAFIRLRDWGEAIATTESLDLPAFLVTKHVPSLSKESLELPTDWAREHLQAGRMLVMFDGFDEVKPEWRSRVSKWIGSQMADYPKARFILTSRPSGYREGYSDERQPDVQLYIKSFNQEQQERFIQKWYWCQERLARGGRNTPDVRVAAENMGDSLIAALAEREELKALAKNPLMLNMIAHVHRWYEEGDLPNRRAELYRDIFNLQLSNRPRAKKVKMLLNVAEARQVLQAIALDMVLNDEVELQREVLLDRLQTQLDIVQPGETVEAIAFLEQMEQVSEVLVKKDECYEFAHLSFQGYLAAAEIKRCDREDLLLDNWRSDKWKETILLYTAQQKNPAPFIRRLIEVGGQDAIALAYECLKESPKAGDEAIMAEIESLRASVQDSRYRQLEEYLKAEQFREADQETARLMLETVGKDMSQFLLVEDIENFPCEELRAIDKLWVDHSGGKFGFSVQSRIYHRLGGTKEYNRDIWLKFASEVGWHVEGLYVSYPQLNFSLQAVVGHLPAGVWYPFVSPTFSVAPFTLSSLAQRCVDCNLTGLQPVVKIPK